MKWNIGDERSKYCIINQTRRYSEWERKQNNSYNLQHTTVVFRRCKHNNNFIVYLLLHLILSLSSMLLFLVNYFLMYCHFFIVTILKYLRISGNNFSSIIQWNNGCSEAVRCSVSPAFVPHNTRNHPWRRMDITHHPSAQWSAYGGCHGSMFPHRSPG